MAFNQSLPVNVPIRQQLQSVASSLSVTTAQASESQERRFDELSSSGIDSDWILFSPSLHEDDDEEDDDNNTDVLSSTGGQSFEEPQQLETSNIKKDEDDDDSSLIDSLNASFDSNFRFALPVHDSGAFLSSSSEDHYSTSLQNNDYITNRIDSWRKEQAKLLIDDLNRDSSSSNTTASSTHHHELLASWGVDDRHLIETQLSSSIHDIKSSTESKKSKTTCHHKNTKRFYGDDVFQNFTEWEVSKIKQVAKQLSSSLVRDYNSHSSHDRHQLQKTGRRSSLLQNITQSNKFHVSLDPQPFWKKDLSSAHSSLSLSTNSIMFGGITFGDVM